jgi:signal transduction histidine kinase
MGLRIGVEWSVITEMHGRRSWVESNLGKGSTLQMTLPTRDRH